jgi:uncharacterized protein HemY
MEARRQNWTLAEKYFRLALESIKKTIDRLNEAKIYRQLGSLFCDQKRWEQAESFYTQALRIHEELNDSLGKAITYQNLGVMAEKRDQFDKAFEYLQFVSASVGDTDEFVEAAANHHLGRIMAKKKQWKKANTYFLAALKEFVKREDTQLIGEVISSMSELYPQKRLSTIPVEIADNLSISLDEARALVDTSRNNE